MLGIVLVEHLKKVREADDRLSVISSQKQTFFSVIKRKNSFTGWTL